MVLDVRNESGIDVPLSILHEGTGNQSVKVSATMVQIPVPGRDDFFLPSPDMWTRTFDEATTFVLTAQGTTGANNSLNLRLEDIDADLTTDPTNPRYVRSGTYVLEITARYEYQPTVAHTQRITIEVEQLDQVQCRGCRYIRTGSRSRGLQCLLHLRSQHRQCTGAVQA